MEEKVKKIGSYWFPNVENHMTPVIEATGGWHADRLEQALRHLSYFRTAVDVGAHVGTWTLMLAKRFRLVFAFEPNPPTYDCLMRNLEDEDVHNTHTFQVGLGARAGWAEAVPDPRWGAGNTGGVWLATDARDGLVRVERLDDVITPEMPYGKIDFMKIDAEGMEAAVLLGARKTIAEHRPLIMWEDKAKFRKRHEIQENPATILHDYGYEQIDAAKCDVIWRARGLAPQRTRAHR